MILKDGTKVHALKDRYNTGYSGFGYGGDRLYVVCLVDCFSPPMYLVRADSFGQAYETAKECLSSSFDEWASAEEVAEMNRIGDMFKVDSGYTNEEASKAIEAFEAKYFLSSSASGRMVSAEDDIRVRQIAGPFER